MHSHRGINMPPRARSSAPTACTRRELLGWTGMSLAGIALDDMITRELSAESPAASDSAPGHGPDLRGRAMFRPRAKSAIWLMMRGGVSHHEGFDPKPELNRLAGKTMSETPYFDAVLKSPYYRNVREQVLNNVIKTDQDRILPLQ